MSRQSNEYTKSPFEVFPIGKHSTGLPTLSIGGAGARFGVCAERSTNAKDAFFISTSRSAYYAAVLPYCIRKPTGATPNAVAKILRAIFVAVDSHFLRFELASEIAKQWCNAKSRRCVRVGCHYFCRFFLSVSMCAAKPWSRSKLIVLPRNYLGALCPIYRLTHSSSSPNLFKSSPVRVLLRSSCQTSLAFFLEIGSSLALRGNTRS
jgi:hypothetical protein